MVDKNKQPNTAGNTAIVRTQDAPTTASPVINENTAATPTTPKPTVAAPDNKVMVDASVLKNIMDKLENLETNQKQFEDTASQDQIRKIEQLRAQGKLVKNVKVRNYDGKIVIGWKVVRDDVWVADHVVHEVQTIRIFFQDNSEKETQLLDFTRNTFFVSGEVIGENKTKEGELELKVMLPDGQEIVINSKYVN